MTYNEHLLVITTLLGAPPPAGLPPLRGGLLLGRTTALGRPSLSRPPLRGGLTAGRAPPPLRCHDDL